MPTTTTLLTPENRQPYLAYISRYAQARLDDPDVFALGIANSRYALGAVVCTCVEDKATILSMMVDEGYRSRGIGSSLMAALARLSSQHQLAELEARYFLDDFPGVLVDSFFAKNGFALVNGGFRMVQTTLGDLVDSPLHKNAVKLTASPGRSSLVRLSDLTTTALHTLLRVAKITPVELTSLSLSLSYAHLKGDKVDGAAFLSQHEEGVEISYLYSTSEATAMVPLFAAAANGFNNYPPETKVFFQLGESLSERLVDKLLGNCKTTVIAERIASYFVPPIELLPDLPQEPLDGELGGLLDLTELDLDELNLSILTQDDREREYTFDDLFLDDDLPLEEETTHD